MDPGKRDGSDGDGTLKLAREKVTLPFNPLLFCSLLPSSRRFLPRPPFTFPVMILLGCFQKASGPCPQKGKREKTLNKEQSTSLNQTMTVCIALRTGLQVSPLLGTVFPGLERTEKGGPGSSYSRPSSSMEESLCTCRSGTRYRITYRFAGSCHGQ